jgi:hypothetical protein
MFSQPMAKEEETTGRQAIVIVLLSPLDSGGSRRVCFSPVLISLVIYFLSPQCSLVDVSTNCVERFNGSKKGVGLQIGKSGILNNTSRVLLIVIVMMTDENTQNRTASRLGI